ncbi:MAG: hypothetical protein ACRC8M_10780 [Cetobacterium sp.]|uniref:hypothetical protein n=1 Tax=Cetobacterium sp. TaxID=2071632 RepID=UPI003F33DBD6
MAKTAAEIKDETEKFKLENGITENEGQDIKADSFEELEQDYGTLKIRGEIRGSNIIKFRTRLTGQDMKICKSRYDREKQTKAKTLAEVDDEYFLMMAERMTGIPYKEFYDLHIVDTNKVVRHVRDFLGE